MTLFPQPVLELIRKTRQVKFVGQKIEFLPTAKAIKLYNECRLKAAQVRIK